MMPVSLTDNMITEEFRSFQIATVDLCRLKGCKVTSCQTWSNEKKICLTASVEPYECGLKFESWTIGSSSKFEGP